MEVHLGLGAEGRLPARRRRAGLRVHGLEDLGWDRAIEELLRLRRVIAESAPRAGFILHLHHQYSALRVRRLEVAHESGEGLDFRFERGGGEGRRRIHRTAGLIDHVRIAFGGQLHPLRHVMLTAVFPRAKPKQNQVNAMRVANTT